MVQSGLSASDWKPIPVIGAGVIEIRVHADGEYRVFYVAKFEDAVYVLHVFAKKTRKTSSLDVELGSDLVRGKIGLFTIDTLVNMVTSAGLKVDVDITAGRPRAKNKQVA